MSTVPVFIQNGRLDAVATNTLGRALFSEMFDDARPPVNAARFVFLDPRAQTFYRHWDANARQIVAILRAEHRTGIKSIHHPVVGDLDLTYQGIDLASDRGLQMLVFSAEPGSIDAERRQLLANWATAQTPQHPAGCNQLGVNDDQGKSIAEARVI